MNFEVIIERRAAQDIDAAYQWYSNIKSILGFNFLQSVAAASERLERNPMQFRLERIKYRRIHLSKFPYALHFTILHSEVKVLACLHTKQSPSRWPGA